MEQLTIDRIKATPLGRAWLSVFVRRVWDEALTSPQRERLCSGLVTASGVAADEFHDAWVRSIRLWSRRRPGNLQHAEDPCLAQSGLLGEVLADGRRPVTPFGVEVYLYGRRRGGG